MSPPLEPDSLLEETIPQLMETVQQQQSSPAATARPGVQCGGEGQDQEDVPSPGRLDDFDFEGSLDAITTACPPPPAERSYSIANAEQLEEEGEGGEGGRGGGESAGVVAGAEEDEVRRIPCSCVMDCTAAVDLCALPSFFKFQCSSVSVSLSPSLARDGRVEAGPSIISVFHHFVAKVADQ